MATGDISSLEISSNGRQITFTIEGLTAGSITGFSSGQFATVGCTSEGYSSTTLGTVSRSGIRTSFVSATDDGGNADIILDLEEPIHDDDTSVTFTMIADRELGV